jgi:hypothetical protein
MARVQVTSASVVIEEVECTDRGVFELFSETPETSLPDLAYRIRTQVANSGAMSIVGYVELLERESGKLSERLGEGPNVVATSLLTILAGWRPLPSSPIASTGDFPSVHNSPSIRRDGPAPSGLKDLHSEVLTMGRFDLELLGGGGNERGGS